MYKNILCAVDTSPESAKILSKAKTIAEQNGAHLSIIHIIQYSLLPRDYQKKLKQEVIPKIDKLADRYNITKKHRYIKFGQSHSTICQIADKLDGCLIVIGSHGKHGIQAFLGSTANGVVQQAQCDTLLVKTT